MHSKVEKFTQAMQKEIDNSHKGDWETFLHKENIMSEFYHHLNKLENVLHPQLIKEYIVYCRL
jgi:hypothetical protein